MTTLRLVRRSSRPLMILILAGAFPTWCQTSDFQDQINSAYRSKILLLRNFYSGRDLSYDQNGVLVGVGSPGPWTLADVQIKHITLTAQEVEIVGERLGVLYTAGKPGLINLGKLKIHVAKPAPDSGSRFAIEPIIAKIFIDPREDVRPQVPDYWRYYLGWTDSQSRSEAWHDSLKKGPVAPLKVKDFPAARLSPPRVVSSPDPEYTKEAASRHIQGISVLGMVIDATGTPGEIAVMRPLGMGLDEQAVSAVKRWHFRPASLDGQAVPVSIMVEINFRCCP